MNLLEDDEVKDRLEQIKLVYGTDASSKFLTTTPKDIDRYFWLRSRVVRHRNGRQSREFFSTVYSPEYAQRCRFRIANLVLQGGGTLGLAHVGFVAGLEAAGVRFLGLAGTSAGAIVTMGMAAIRGRKLTKATNRRLTEFVASMPMDEFIDGPRPVRKFIKQSLNAPKLTNPSYWIRAAMSIRRLRDRRGMNQGDAFERWLETSMQELEFPTIDNLNAALNAIWDDIIDLRKGLKSGRLTGEDNIPVVHSDLESRQDKVQDQENLNEHRGVSLLKLMTMAMPAGLKLSLPEDLKLLEAEYQFASPARLVRTSMSVPGFFEPVVMRTNAVEWKKRVKMQLAPLLSVAETKSLIDLEELWFLDGGMMSNLPSDSFRSIMSNVPTIVVPLASEPERKKIGGQRTYGNLLSDVFASFSAVRGQRDREVWAQNQDIKREFERAEVRIARERRAKSKSSRIIPERIYPTQIARIDTGGTHWLNFVMDDGEKRDLFLSGLDSALSFLNQIGVAN